MADDIKSWWLMNPPLVVGGVVIVAALVWAGFQYLHFKRWVRAERRREADLGIQRRRGEASR